MPQVYATATHIPTGEITRTLGPFESLHEARQAVGQAVEQMLTWSPDGQGGYQAEKYPTLWTVKGPVTPDTSGPPGGCPMC